MTSPVEDATIVKEALTPVTLTFTESANAIDQGSLVYGKSVMLINVTDTTASALVAGAISYNVATKVLTFIPTGNWTASDKINIIITPDVRDTAGNNMAAVFVGHFTVAA